MGEKRETLLRLDRLEVGYEGCALLPPISFSVLPHHRWAVVGTNGSGKTTLLRTILGLLPAVQGAVVKASGTCVSYVPQRASLDLSVPMRAIDIVRGGLERRWSFLNPTHVGRHRHVVERALKQTRTSELARQQFAHLSEGQKQRVLIARALVAQPNVLILDEPTSAMDMAAESEVFELISSLQKERELGVLLVSHHLQAAVRFATHGLFIDKESQGVFAGAIADLALEETLTARYGKLVQDVVREAEVHNG